MTIVIMEQKRIKVRLTENSPYSDYGYYEKWDIGYIDGYVNDNAVIILENGKFAKADLRWIEVVNEEDKNVNTELKESEDERIRKEIIELVMQPTWKTEKEFNRRNELCEWLEKQGKTSPVLSNSSNTGKVEQKPAEWSEEDEKQLQHAMLALQWYAGGTDIIDWLKSIKDKVQPKQEWSEEDETMLNCCLGAVNTTDYFDEDNKDKMKNWLKSLRPQSHWKPSDEQIEALSHMIDAVEDEWVCEEPIGRELLKQLKKLREE